jgi:hypothetical protein
MNSGDRKTMRIAKASSGKKALSPRQHEELLRTLKARFEKNTSRHKGLEWAEVQAKLQASTEKLWSLNEMERTGGERMWLVNTRRRATTFFVTVQRRVPKAAEVFATTVKRWSQGRKPNQKITLLTWQRPWALSS